MKNEKENQSDEVLQSKYEAMILLNENLINKNQNLLKENQELINLYTTYKKNAAEQQASASKDSTQRNTQNLASNRENGIGNLNSDSEKNIEKLDKEKKLLEEQFIEINVDIQNKKQLLEDIQDEIAGAKKNLNKVDSEILAKMDFINFLEKQYKEVLSRTKAG